MLAVALVGWGLATYDGQQTASSPASVPTVPPALPDLETGRPVATLYPPGVLDGHWRSAPLVHAVGPARRGDRLTLLVRGKALAVWAGQDGSRRLVAYDAVWLSGHRMELRPVGTDRVGRYRWRLAQGSLVLRPVAGTDGGAHRRLVGRTFSRA